MEKLEFGFEVKEVDSQGTVEGWASTYDLDLGNDQVIPGAFKTTIRKTAGKIPMLLNHDRNRIIGVGVDAIEDHKGLYVKAQLAMSTQGGRETYELMEMGALKGLSIGFKLPKDGWFMNGKVRMLKSIDLFEYSATPFPMNMEAQVMRVKAVEDMTERDLEELLREVKVFSKKDVLCLMAKGGKQLLKEKQKERREAGSDDEVQDEADALLYDFQKHMDDLSAKQMLASLSQHIT